MDPYNRNMGTRHPYLYILVSRIVDNGRTFARCRPSSKSFYFLFSQYSTPRTILPLSHKKFRCQKFVWVINRARPVFRILLLKFSRVFRVKIHFFSQPVHEPCMRPNGQKKSVGFKMAVFHAFPKGKKCRKKIIIIIVLLLGLDASDARAFSQASLSYFTTLSNVPCL